MFRSFGPRNPMSLGLATPLASACQTRHWRLIDFISPRHIDHYNIFDTSNRASRPLQQLRYAQIFNHLPRRVYLPFFALSLLPLFRPAYLAPLMLRCLRRSKRFVTFPITTVLAHCSNLSPPALMLGLVSFVFPPHCVTQLSLSCPPHALYIWLLLYPLATAFSLSLGACHTLAMLWCLLHNMLYHHLSYNCPGMLLFLLFPHTSSPLLLHSYYYWLCIAYHHTWVSLLCKCSITLPYCNFPEDNRVCV